MRPGRVCEPYALAVEVPSPECDQAVGAVEVRQRPFGGYGLRCLNEGCANCGVSVVYHRPG